MPAPVRGRRDDAGSRQFILTASKHRRPNGVWREFSCSTFRLLLGTLCSGGRKFPLATAEAIVFLFNNNLDSWQVTDCDVRSKQLLVLKAGDGWLRTNGPTPTSYWSSIGGPDATRITTRVFIFAPRFRRPASPGPTATRSISSKEPRATLPRSRARRAAVWSSRVNGITLN
jgi:hypothetical protein